ncbi:MAG: C2H2-type zinc finger protein [Thermoproteota archaeon]|nr:C2H2-type zinc finger protein [Thermoproteota archaeon]
MGSSSEQKHECKICGAVFSSAEQLSDHSATHYTKTEGQEDQTR